MKKRDRINLPAYLRLHAGNKALFYGRLQPEKIIFGTQAKQDLPGCQSLDELQPKPEDYLKLKFRALSAAYLGEFGYYLDFSRPGVLQASIPLMLPKDKGGSRRTMLKFHRNHSEEIEARIGFVTGAEWGDATGDQNYPGINIDVLLDWKLAPNEARQLMSDPPLIDSVSVAVIFEFERSHPDLPSWTFFDMLGREVDGEIVRIIVSKILDYRHVGLVTEGADEEADIIERMNQNFINSQNLHQNNPPPGSSSGQAGKQHNGGDSMKLILNAEHCATLRELLGLDEDELTEQGLAGAVEGLVASNRELREAKRAAAEREKQFDAFLKSRREALQATIAKLEPESKLIGMVEKFGLAEIDELDAEYRERLEKAFPLRCADCGSRSVERRSSVEKQPNPAGHENGVAIKPGNFRIAG